MSDTQTRQAPPITVKNLQGGYNGQAVIHDCSMAIEAGEIVVIMGGSGSGKSTFLRHLIGLKEPMQGDVELFGKSLYQVDEFERLRCSHRQRQRHRVSVCEHASCRQCRSYCGRKQRLRRETRRGGVVDGEERLDRDAPAVGVVQTVGGRQNGTKASEERQHDFAQGTHEGE